MFEIVILGVCATVAYLVKKLSDNDVKVAQARSDQYQETERLRMRHEHDRAMAWESSQRLLLDEGPEEK